VNITDPLVLRNDVVLVPATELPDEMRAKFEFEEGDYTISLRHGRDPSQVIDGETASLLELFRKPRTIVEAVIENSRALRKDPQVWLDELLPHLGTFLNKRVLVPVGAENEREFEQTLANGSHLGEWEVLHCVSLIEDSEVYKVRSHDRDAALKIARRKLPFETSLFGNEAMILRRLDGAIGPAMYDSGLHNERPYLIIEWCAGADAGTATAHRRHDRAALLEIACGIADAYAQLHARGVIHGDVHPRNVVIDDDGTVRLIDFGLAAVAGEAPRVGRGGMYYFFEPEYLAATRSGNPHTAATLLGEQYSLGAMLYLILGGKHYLDFGIERDEMIRQAINDPPLPFAKRGGAPWPDVEKILFRALDKDQARRFATTSELADELRRAHETAVAEALATPLSTEARAFADRLLGSFARGGEMFATGYPEAPTASINFGAAGAAVALLRVAEVRSDPALLALAEIWKSRAARDIGRHSAFYNEEGDLPRNMLGDVSPYHTESGVHAAAALIAHARGDVSGEQRAVERFIAASSRDCAEIDLTLGKCATLLGCAQLYELSDSVKPLGDATLDAVWRELDLRPPIAESAAGTFTGIAHGWAGYLYATLRWCAASGTPVPAELPRRLDELADVRVRRGRASAWRRQIGGNPHDIISGWCNGSAGFVFLWTAAYDAFGDERFLRLAEEAAWHNAEEPLFTADLCCGSAGRAYALLNLYRHTGAQEWLSRARRMANHAAGYDGEQQRTNSLWKGELGVAVLVADLESPEQARMPFFE
jgi:serine/threonine-protein kinase